MNLILTLVTKFLKVEVLFVELENKTKLSDEPVNP